MIRANEDKGKMNIKDTEVQSVSWIIVGQNSAEQPTFADIAHQPSVDTIK
jgi:hypothetical protein